MDDAPIGLHNNDNTCYLNAVIQLFLSSRCFLYTLLVEMNPDEVDENSIITDTQKFYLTGSDYHAQRLKKHILRKLNFPKNEQQDAGETFTLLLDMFPRSIQLLFEGNSEQILTCAACNKKSITEQKFAQIALPIPNNEMPTKLCVLLRKFYSPHNTISKDCTKCVQFSDFGCQINVKKMPLLIMMNIKRFTKKLTKIHTEIIYPTKLKVKSELYSLVGLITHSGSFSGGHYVSYIKKLNSWYLCDDANVTPCLKTDFEKQTQKTVYILMYQKVRWW